MMTQYCSTKAVKANRSVEQEVIRQRDTAEVKAHMLKTRLSAVKSVNRQVAVQACCTLWFNACCCLFVNNVSSQFTLCLTSASCLSLQALVVFMG